MSRVADDTQSVAASQMSINFGKLFSGRTQATSATLLQQVRCRSDRSAFGKFHDSGSIKDIGQSHLSIRCSHFQLISVTNHFNAIFLQFPLQILPVVPVLRVIILCVHHADNIKHTVPPLGILLIPNGPDFSVVEETYGYLGHRLWIVV